MYIMIFFDDFKDDDIYFNYFCVVIVLELDR